MIHPPFPFLSNETIAFLGQSDKQMCGWKQVRMQGSKCGWKRRLGTVTHPRGRDDHDPPDIRGSHADLSQSPLGDPRGQRQRALGEPLESSVGVNPQADLVTKKIIIKKKKRQQHRISKTEGPDCTNGVEGRGGTSLYAVRQKKKTPTNVKGRTEERRGGILPNMCALLLLSPEHSLDPWTLASLAKRRDIPLERGRRSTAVAPRVSANHDGVMLAPTRRNRRRTAARKGGDGEGSQQPENMRRRVHYVVALSLSLVLSFSAETRTAVLHHDDHGRRVN